MKNIAHLWLIYIVGDGLGYRLRLGLYRNKELGSEPKYVQL